MSAVFSAIVAELADETPISNDNLDRLADLLAPRIAQRLDHRPAGDDAWLRGAPAIAAHLGCVVSRVYALSSAGRIPVQRDGSALVARRSELDAWLRAGGSKRP
jgi:hypothetical protein